MREALRSCLIAIIIISLIEAPVFSAPAPVLGVVVQAERARVGWGGAVGGATIYEGDLLQTETGGTLHAQIGAARFYLLTDSAAAVRRNASAVAATLQRGTAVFASAAAGAIELQASLARIRPRTAEPTLAQVTLVGPYELLLTSNRGELEVTIGEELHIVAPATSYRVLIEPPTPGGRGSPPREAARSRFIIVALIVISIVSAYGIWRALVSPDRPS